MSVLTTADFEEWDAQAQIIDVNLDRLIERYAPPEFGDFTRERAICVNRKQPTAERYSGDTLEWAKNPVCHSYRDMDAKMFFWSNESEHPDKVRPGEYRVQRIPQSAYEQLVNAGEVLTENP